MKAESAPTDITALSFLGALPKFIQYVGEPPKAPSQFVFLLDAVEQAGRTLFGPRWTGEELHALDWPVSPMAEVEAAHEAAKREARWEIDKRTGKTALIGTHLDEAWVRVKAEAAEQEERWSSNNAAIGRLRDAAEELEKLFRDGKVQTASRGKTGGFGLREIRPEEWCRDNLFETVFRTGELNRWFAVGKEDIWQDVYVFVDRETLKQATKVKPEVTGLDITGLSPFLQLAIRVALEEGVTAETGVVTADKKQAIIAAINAAKSTYDLDDEALGERAVEYMATFIRWPGARLGRAKIKG